MFPRGHRRVFNVQKVQSTGAGSGRERGGSGVGSWSGYGWSASGNGARAWRLRPECKREWKKKRGGYSFSQRWRGRGASQTSGVTQYRRRGCPRAIMRGHGASRTSGLFTQSITRPPKSEKEPRSHMSPTRRRGYGATMLLGHQRYLPQVMMSYGAARSLARSLMRDGGFRILSDFGSYAVANVAAIKRGGATEPLFAKDVYGPRSRPVANDKYERRCRSVPNEADHTR